MKYKVIGDKGFFNEIFSKIFSSFAKLSVWGFMFVFGIASWLCHGSFISGDNWSLVVSIGFAGFLGYRSADKWIKKN